jgi:hypothetical protein
MLRIQRFRARDQLSSEWGWKKLNREEF